MMALELEKLNIRKTDIIKHPTLNGLDYLLIEENMIKPKLQLYFLNDNLLNTEITVSTPYWFVIKGGNRILGREDERTQNMIFSDPTFKINQDTVFVESILSVDMLEKKLVIELSQFGDYDTYVIEMVHDKTDNVFYQLEFKFRPGCYQNVCDRDFNVIERKSNPVIDYLAKDYDSFKHIMITAMQQRVPYWTPSSEVDFDQVLIELMSGVADELSYFQDRVANEAYLATAQNRISLARHGKLFDYYVFQGNQADTWITLRLNEGEEYEMNSESTPLIVKNNPEYTFEKKIIFMTDNEDLNAYFHYFLNELHFYTWDDTRTYLPTGSTEADLTLPEEYKDEGNYNMLKNFIQENKVTHFLIQENYQPTTGTEINGYPSKRQILRLVSESTDIRYDQLREEFLLHIEWHSDDKLLDDYTFTSIIDTSEGNKEYKYNISSFYGNLVKVFQGDPVCITFVPSGHPDLLFPEHYPYSRTRYGVVCKLPHKPIQFKNKYGNYDPDGTLYCESTIEVKVEYSGTTEWEEKSTLVLSRGDDLHYIVETNDYQETFIRFGNDVNGQALPENAKIQVCYQLGRGEDGNIGADTVTVIDERSQEYNRKIEKIWNPQAIVNGKSWTPREQIVRELPEAFRNKQFRAITVNEKVDDYEELCLKHPDVSKASAKYRWSGGWRIVELSIDPVGSMVLTSQIENEILNYINALKLIGDKIFIKKASYAPLDISIRVCVKANYWVQDILDKILDEFSAKFTKDGRKGFFNPDNWSFGDSISKSQLIARILNVEGVDQVIDSLNYPLIIKRWGQPDPHYPTPETFIVEADEIIQVLNDPTQIEKGCIRIATVGGLI